MLSRCLIALLLHRMAEGKALAEMFSRLVSRRPQEKCCWERAQRMFLLFQDEVSRPLQDMAYRENPISNFGINITIEDALRDMLVISCFFMFILFLVLAGLSPKGKNE